MQLAIGALLVTASELLLRRGAQDFHDATGLANYFGIAALGSWWTWLGIICYILSFASWLHVLRFVPLSIAFPAINIVHVLVPLGAAAILHEHVTGRRWLGIGLVLIGIMLIVRPVVKAEGQL
jgi:drug/metabolite transporter (DMT)-like permease